MNNKYNTTLSILLLGAIDEGDFDKTVNLLHDSRVDPTLRNNYALRHAAKYGYLPIVKLLLADSRVDPTALDNMAIKDAAYEGMVAIVKLLYNDKRVNKSFDISKDSNYVFNMMCREGDLDMVELLLLDDRLDPTMNNNYALRLAAEGGFYQIIEVLLADSRIDAGYDENDALNQACYHNHFDCAALLLTNEKVLSNLKYSNNLHYIIPKILIEKYDYIQTEEEAKMFILLI